MTTYLGHTLTASTLLRNLFHFVPACVWGSFGPIWPWAISQRNHLPTDQRCATTVPATETAHDFLVAAMVLETSKGTGHLICSPSPDKQQTKEHVATPWQPLQQASGKARRDVEDQAEVPEQQGWTAWVTLAKSKKYPWVKTETTEMSSSRHLRLTTDREPGSSVSQQSAKAVVWTQCSSAQCV